MIDGIRNIYKTAEAHQPAALDSLGSVCYSPAIAEVLRAARVVTTQCPCKSVDALETALQALDAESARMTVVGR